MQNVPRARLGLDYTFANLVILSWKDVQSLVPYTKQHIARLERAGKFPQRVRLGAGRVGWLYVEVEAWIQARLAERGAPQA